MISSFQILGQTIEVIIDNEYCHKNKCYGQFIPFENKIIIANKLNVIAENTINGITKVLVNGYKDSCKIVGYSNISCL